MKKEKRKSNVTIDRLSGLPFRSASELKKAQEEIQMETWKQLERARTLNELVKKEEFSFWRQEFREGLSCRFEKEEQNLFRVFSPGQGIRIHVNKTLASADPSNESLIGTLVQSVSESFASTYYKAKGFLSSPSDSLEDKKA